MEQEEEDGEELQMMWAAVTGFSTVGSVVVRFDNGETTLIPKFWAKLWGHDPATLKVGTRLRCAVAVEWKPDYSVKAIFTAVHEGGKK